jgi:hypothetical protein
MLRSEFIPIVHHSDASIWSIPIPTSELIPKLRSEFILIVHHSDADIGSILVPTRALRSGPVRFFTLLEGGPTTGPVILFQKYQKNRTGPYRTSPLWFRAVSGPVQTGPEPISVLTSHRTGQDWLSTY